MASEPPASAGSRGFEPSASLGGDWQRRQPGIDCAHEGAAPGPTEPVPARRELLFDILLALGLALGLYFVQRRIDWNPSDEGFFWYGVLRTAHGGVPLRDFRSYDPGRYYWAAAWARMLGDGILALRFSSAIFQAGGILCGLRAARRAIGSRWALAAVGLLLLLWMSPRHKLFEPSIALAAVLVSVRLLERPSLGRIAAAGGLVGLAAFLGKNHGLYCAAATFAVVLLAHFRLDPVGFAPRLLLRRLAAWAGGGVVGFLPMLALFPIPGFFASYIDSFRFFIAQGKTNYPEPFPWPWKVASALIDSEGSPLDVTARAQRVAFGVILLAIPLLLAAAAYLVARLRRENLDRRALAAAGGIVGLAYCHYIYSRTDVFHLTQGIPPLLLVAVALPLAVGPRRRTAVAGLVAGVLVAATAFVVLPQLPLYHWLQQKPEAPFVPFDLAGDTVYLRRRQADVLGRVGGVLEARVPAGEAVFFAAHIPGYYPAFRRPSPVWDTYPMWPGKGGEDERMRGELERSNVRWALIAAYPMLGSDELIFWNSHPESWAYLEKNFERVAKGELPRRLWLMHRRGTPPDATAGRP